MPVVSVAGRTGAVVLTSADVGLGSVDNTADANKPVSTAQQTALNFKLNAAAPTYSGLLSNGAITYSDTGILAQFVSATAGVNQVIHQNTSNAANASANINVSNDSGSATTNYGELGINSSTFTGTGAFSQAGTVYVGSGSTDLAIGTYGANAIHFVVNNGATDAMTITSAGVPQIGGVNIVAVAPGVSGNVLTSTGSAWASQAPAAPAAGGSAGSNIFNAINFGAM